MPISNRFLNPSKCKRYIVKQWYQSNLLLQTDIASRFLYLFFIWWVYINTFCVTFMHDDNSTNPLRRINTYNTGEKIIVYIIQASSYVQVDNLYASIKHRFYLMFARLLIFANFLRIYGTIYFCFKQNRLQVGFSF